jgi:hypothetical protein
MCIEGKTWGIMAAMKSNLYVASKIKEYGKKIMDEQ